MADKPCTIGKQITIRGNLSGAEDLVVEGRIEGTISLGNHLTVASSGTVEADLEVADLSVDGMLGGEISATRSVSINSQARVVGNLRTPRLVIADGARFKGRIEMEVDLPDDLRE